MKNKWMFGLIVLFVVAVAGVFYLRDPSPEPAPDSRNETAKVPLVDDVPVGTVTSIMPVGNLKLQDIKGDELPSSSLLIGNGFNSATGERGGNCVAYDPYSPEAAKQLSTTSGTATGDQGNEITMKEVSSREELRDQMRISANASLGTGVFAGSGSYTQFASTRSFKYSRNILIKGYVETKTKLLVNKKLTRDARAAAVENNLSRFIGKCGDYFVSGVKEGGELLVMLTVTLSTESQQKATQAMAEVSSGFTKGAIDFQQATEKLKELGSLDLYMFRRGDQDNPNLEQLKTMVVEFASKVRAHPAVLAVKLDSYNNVDDRPAGLASVRTIVSTQDKQLRAIAIALDDEYGRNADLTHITRNGLRLASGTDALELHKSVQKRIDELLGMARNCITNPPTGCTQSIALPTFPSLATLDAAPAMKPGRWIKDESKYFQPFEFNTTERYRDWKESNGTGVFRLSRGDARIYRVEYSCFDSGTGRCGVSYDQRHPASNAEHVEIEGNSFKWYRRWEALPVIDKYKAFYEVCEGKCEW